VLADTNAVAARQGVFVSGQHAVLIS